ncbi:MAG: CDP-alcohol phosphatidyltransferase family protein, partial [Chloroflexi bacterium]
MSLVPPRAATGMRGGLAPVARWLHRAGVGANTVTIVGLLLTALGAALLGGGQPAPALIVLLLGTLADTLDGQVAKAAGGGTKFGAFLDSTADRIS